MANVPRGYVYRPAAQSVIEAISGKASNDRAKTITKMAVKDYIATFFDSNGSKRNILRSFSPSSLQYITDLSYEESGKDPTRRYTQLAIFFEQLKKRLPFILVIDNGIETIKSGIGQNIDSMRLVQGTTRIDIPIIRKLNLNVVVGTKDEDTTDMLSTALSILFNEMHFIAGGDRLAGNPQAGDSWEVRLPYAGIEQTAGQHDNIPEDPVESFWWTETTLPGVWFEDVIQLDAGTIRVQMEAPVVDSKPSSIVSIVFPSTLKINQQQSLVVTGHDGSFEVNIDDPRIANFDPQVGVITPRRLGTFTIRVMRSLAKGSENALLAEKAVEVTF